MGGEGAEDGRQKTDDRRGNIKEGGPLKTSIVRHGEDQSGKAIQSPQRFWIALGR